MERGTFFFLSFSRMAWGGGGGDEDKPKGEAFFD